MPRRDGTGPMGMGEMTRRGMGFCNTSRTYGRMGGLGRGWRFGCRRIDRFALKDDADSKDEKDILIEQKNFLENRLNLIKKELEEFEK